MANKTGEIADQIALFIDVFADPGKHPTRRRNTLAGTEVVELVAGGKKYSITVLEKR